MKLKQITIVAVAAIVLLTACGKKAPGYTKYIPKNATNVIAIDVKSMLTKLNSDSLTIENMLAVLKDEKDPEDYTTAITKYNELKDAGIDFESKLYVSISSLEAMNTGGSPDVQMVAGVKDVAKLEAFLKKQKGMGDIKKGEGFSYINEGDETAFGWTNDALMVIYGGRKKSFTDYIPEDSMSGSKPKSETNVAGATEKLKKYFKLEKKESILSVDGFNDLLDKKADVAMFSQTNLDGVNAMAFAFVPKLKELIEGTYSTTFLNFEDGKAVIESNTFTGKKMGEILKKYAGPQVDLSLIENYPSQNVDGVVAFSFNPAIVPAIIKETGLDALLGLGLAQTGMGLDDFGKIFKGDFAVAVSDFSVAKQEVGKDAEMYSTTMPAAKVIFTARIGDKAAFDKLISLGVQKGAIIRNGNSIVLADNGAASASLPFAINIANDVLTFASDSATMVAFQSKTQKIGLTDDVKSKLKGSAIAVFADAEKILNGINDNMFDTSDVSPKEILAMAKTTFKNGWFTTSNFDGKSVTGKGEMVFADPKKNSLAQIVRFSMFTAEKAKASRANRMKQWEDRPDVVVEDSVATPSAPATVN